MARQSGPYQNPLQSPGQLLPSTRVTNFKVILRKIHQVLTTFSFHIIQGQRWFYKLVIDIYPKGEI